MGADSSVPAAGQPAALRCRRDPQPASLHRALTGSTTRWVEIASLALFLLVLGTGTWIWATDLFAPGYFSVLELHVWAGVLALASFPVALAVHLRRSRSAPGPAARQTAVAILLMPVLAALVASLGRGLHATPWRGGFGEGAGGMGWLQAVGMAVASPNSGDRFFTVLSVLLALALLAGTVAVAFIPALRSRGAVRSTAGAFMAGAAALACLSGILATWGRGDARFAVMELHSLVGLGCVVGAIAHTRIVRPLSRGMARNGAVLAVAAILGLAWQANWSAEHEAGLEPRSIPGSWPVATLGDPSQPSVVAAGTLDEAMLTGSAGCGVDECHPALTEQWEGSAHRFSADNDLYRAVVKRFVEAAGPEQAAFCAGCHDPVRALAGSVGRDYAEGTPPPGEGVACSICHGLYAFPGTVRNGSMSVQQPIAYPGTAEQRNRRVLRDPRFHRQNFVVDPVTVSGHACGPCHRLTLGPFIGLAEETTLQAAYDPTATEAGTPTLGGYEHLGPEVLCSDCHMPIRTVQPRGPLKLYDHGFAGANHDLPAYARHPDANQGALTVVAEDTERLRWGDGGDQGQAGGSLRMEVVGERVGAALHLAVKTWNEAIGHSFPSGPADLREVWLETLVLDDEGRILAHLGGPGDDGAVDPTAPRLGAVEIGLDGTPLRQHRVWEVRGVRDKRVVPAFGFVDDVLDLELPTDAQGPIRVEMTWWMRHTPTAFTRWVYGDEVHHFPPRAVARGRWSEEG